jgi:hypothetical protein
VRAQTCAKHYTSSIGGQTAGHVLGVGVGVGVGARTSAKRGSTGMEQGAATAASANFECGEHAGRMSRVGISRVARSTNKTLKCVISDRHRC